MSPTSPNNPTGSTTGNNGNTNLAGSLGETGGLAGGYGDGGTAGSAGLSGSGVGGTSDSLGTSGTAGTAGFRQHAGQAGSHLAQAARDTGSALKGAASAAADELRLGGANVRADLADGTLEGIAAAQQASAAAREQMDVLMAKGRDLVDSASALIRERPVAAFGVAFAAGWIISKLGRSSDR